jgi:hypothetical protein
MDALSPARLLECIYDCVNEEEILAVLNEHGWHHLKNLLSLLVEKETPYWENLYTNKVYPKQEVHDFIRQQHHIILFREYLEKNGDDIQDFLLENLEVLLCNDSYTLFDNQIPFNADNRDEHPLFEHFMTMCSVVITLIMESESDLDAMKYVKNCWKFVKNPDCFWLARRTVDTNNTDQYRLNLFANTHNEESSELLKAYIEEYIERHNIQGTLLQQLELLHCLYLTIDNPPEKLGNLFAAYPESSRGIPGYQPPGIESLTSFYRMAQYIFEKTGNRRLWTISLLCEAFAWIDADNDKRAYLNRAMGAFLKIREYYDVIPESLRANYHNYLGRIYGSPAYDSLNIELAIREFKTAVLLFEAMRDRISLALAQNNLAKVLIDSAEGDAIVNLRQAKEHLLKSRNGLEDTDNITFRLLPVRNFSKALIHWQQLTGEYTLDENLEMLHGFIASFDKNNWPLEWAQVQDLFHELYSLGVTSQSVETAIDYLEHALNIYKSYGSPIYKFRAYKSLADLYSSKTTGDIELNIKRAHSLYEEALELAEKEENFKWYRELSIDYALSLSQKSKKYNSCDLFNKALTIAANALDKTSEADDPEEWARIHHQTGIIYQFNRDLDPEWFAKGLGHFNAALKYRQDNPIKTAGTLNSIGTLYHYKTDGDVSENRQFALSYYQQAIQLYTEAGALRLAANALKNAGLLVSKDYDRITPAERELAINCLEKASDYNTLDIAPDFSARINIRLGILYYQLDDIERAQDRLLKGHEAVELIRSQNLRLISKKEVAAEFQHLYHYLVSIFLKCDNISDAYYYGVMGKSRSLTDRLQNGNPLPDKYKIASTDFERQWSEVEQIRAKLEEVRSQAHRPVDSVNYHEYLQNRKSTDSQYSYLSGELKRKLDELYLDFPQLTMAEPARVAETKYHIDWCAGFQDSAFLEFVNHAEGVGLFVFSGGQMYFSNLGNIIDSILSYSIWIDNYQKGDEDCSYWSTQLKIFANLYSELLHSVKAHLSSVTNIVIMPTTGLHFIPFAAVYDLETEEFLIENYSISYSFSLPILQAIVRNSVGHKNRYETLLSVLYADEGKNELPLVKQAFGVFSKLFAKSPKSLYLHDAEATPDRVIEACSSYSYDVIHFSSHGESYENDFLKSGLVLKDGALLTVENIYSSFSLLKPSLVFLGACVTGKFKLDKGDESTGLVDGILAGGAANTISTLWYVNEKATQTAIIEFYTALKKKKPAGALREAMLALIKSGMRQQPYLWAGFKLYGIGDLIKKH